MATLFLSLSLAGCSWIPFIGGDDEKNTDIPEEVETNEQRLYRSAQRSLRSSNYTQAIGQLEALEARFPFGRYAEQAQLELIYARYMSYELDGARAAAERFIRLHPQHSNIDYAFYIKGLSAFSKNQSIMDRLFETDYARRDTEPARDAYADFAQLLARFPNSKYVPDAKQRMVHLRNLLARSEMAIADYYMRRGAYIAAANRARYVLEVYPKSESTPDALTTLVEANHKLGLTDEANNALRVLALNYPSNPAFDESGSLVLTEQIRNRDRSWTNIMTLGLLDRPDVPPPIRIQHPDGFSPEQLTPRDVLSDSSLTPRERVDGPGSSAEKKKKRGWFSWLPFVD
ncbi:MAG: outer membrane protein assembly factor BamD [Pseudomonadota bacterium]